MKTKNGKRIIDIAMSLVLLFLMAYQVTGDLYHEILGAAMLVLFIIHNILNIRWYGKLFNGKYSAIRVLWTVINLAIHSVPMAAGASARASPPSPNWHRLLKLEKVSPFIIPAVEHSVRM